MRFAPNEDQATFLGVLDQMAEGHEAHWRTSPDWSRFDWSAAFDRMLEDNGFLDCAREETLGLVAAAALTHRVARLPVLAECAASSVLRPMVGAELPRPIAVVEGRDDAATRFLTVARSVILIEADGIRTAVLTPNAVAPVDSLFAYPMGRLTPGATDWRAADADPQRVRNAWRAALAAELGGVLKGGLDAVVAYVKDRHQFGRPLGSFQAIQHRLASAAAKIEAAYWLALKAAHSLDPADAMGALGFVQEAATRITNDLHQFMGAMGLTLEHPLHRWTYRARLLRSAMGGAGTHLQGVADTRWRAA
ncbi:acyl-CoA dehydrogenase family protein [uncultured Alsobacter sp.]|uniref:acyl-CoA dehydrogenase family protein n=1 Tax=uncultured Alsobacter sp. TaxID=1748258 RepID=UPI0025D750C0|nr:acyl-CoA dehydrogenase family protein [uncultured Alsobacter sp.]